MNRVTLESSTRQGYSRSAQGAREQANIGAQGIKTGAQGEQAAREQDWSRVQKIERISLLSNNARC